MDDDELEVLFDVTGPTRQAEITEMVAGICAGVVLAWYSATELLSEIRKYRNLKRASNDR